MVVYERADVVVRASFSRREAIERAQTRGAVHGDPMGVVDPFVLAEERREDLIAKEARLASDRLGREVRARVWSRERNAVTSAAFISASALVAFEVVGPEGLWWRPDDVKPAPKLADVEDAP